MTLPVPSLDDRTFSELVEEARKRIPVYAPEWTDHNLHDPGMTLIELLAWLTETALYRLDLVTERHKRKYIKLLGIRPKPSLPARVDLTFDPDQPLSLSKGQTVLAKTGERSVCFELDRNVLVSPVKLKKVIVDEMTRVSDRTEENIRADLFFAPFGLNVQRGCSLYLGFDRGPSVLNLMCHLYEEDLISAGTHGDEEGGFFESRPFRWEITTTPHGDRWEEVIPVEEGTGGLRNSGGVVFEGLNGWASSIAPIWKEPFFWLRCVVLDPSYEYPPRISAVVPNTIPATQGRTIQGKEEWKGSGLPEQRFTLDYKPLLDGSLGLTVDGVAWKEMDDFDRSGPDAPHFELNREKGEILFGDGISGRVPPAGSSIRVEKYRIGGGEEGNLPAGSVWVLGDEKKQGLSISNFKAAVGGRGAETVEEAKVRFLKDLKVPYRTVTSRDFEYLAVNTPGLRVSKAKAIANYRPEIGEVLGHVTVVVIPFTPLTGMEKPPEPSDEFKRIICDHLDGHRLLGTEIRVVGPIYVRVSVRVSLSAIEGQDEASLRTAVADGLDQFLNPVKGGEGGQGWPVGRPVYRSEVLDRIQKIDGVDCVTEVSLSGDRGAVLDRDGNLALPSRMATVYPGRHTVTLLRGVERCRKVSGYGKD